ncbi:MAG: hypothetical protein ABIK89_11745 [Planctomycetota bacterium]
MVIFIVMVVIVMISLAGLSFVITMSTENKAVHLHGDELQIEQAVGSGAELLKAFAALSLEEREEAGGGYDNPELFRAAIVVEGKPEGHRARFSVVSPRTEDGLAAGVRFGAENESARLNLASLPQWEKQRPGAARDALMNLPGMTEPIAEAILDWIDDDPTPRPNGAEADYYSGLGVPYGPRNGIPTSLEELLLIRDVSRELLFGADADFNFQTGEAERQFASPGAGIGMAQSGLPWASLMTVYSAERNAGFEGTPRIHLNEKDLAKLHEAIGEAFDSDWADFIVAYRQFGPHEEDGGVDRQEGPGRPRSPRTERGPRRDWRPQSARTGRGGAEAVKLDLSLPAKFEIESVLDLVGVQVQLADPDAPPSDDDPPPVLDSPLSPDQPTARDDLFKLVDQTEVVGDKVIRGRINVNEAPREVLLGVPGMDPSTVDQILTARGPRTAGDDSSRRHALWLYTEGIVDLDEMRALLPYLTTGGDVFRAQVVGFFDDSGPSARAELVVDATASPPKQVYWKDLRLLGRGYSLETLGAESTLEDASISQRAENLFPVPQLD